MQQEDVPRFWGNLGTSSTSRRLVVNKLQSINYVCIIRESRDTVARIVSLAGMAIRQPNHDFEGHQTPLLSSRCHVQQARDQAGFNCASESQADNNENENENVGCPRFVILHF